MIVCNTVHRYIITYKMLCKKYLKADGHADQWKHEDVELVLFSDLWKEQKVETRYSWVAHEEQSPKIHGVSKMQDQIPN